MHFTIKFYLAISVPEANEAERPALYSPDRVLSDIRSLSIFFFLSIYMNFKMMINRPQYVN